MTDAFIRAAQAKGVAVTYGAPAPDGSRAARGNVLPLVPQLTGS